MHESHGHWFEDFIVGDEYHHGLGRTVLSADNSWFTQLTLNTNPLHFDHHYAAGSEFGRPLVNSCLTLSLVTGISVADLSQNAAANLGWDDVRLPRPVFEGDTIYAQSKILEVRPSASRPNVGIIRVRTTGLNQDGQTVIEFERTIMVYRKGKGPLATHPRAMAPTQSTGSRRRGAQK